MRLRFSSGGCAFSVESVLEPNEQDNARPDARIQSGPSHAAKGGAPPPPAIMIIASALPGLLTATAAPAMTWLPLNVAIVDNDRGASPSSYRARALGAGAQEVSRGTASTHAGWEPLPGTCC